MTFTDDSEVIVHTEKVGSGIAASAGHRVTSYEDLLYKIALLRYYNPRFSLLFRGQGIDYKLGKGGKDCRYSSLYPSILRGIPGVSAMRVKLADRFVNFHKANELMKEDFLHPDVQRDKLVRWALLQHYEVCDTPLLDVTSSVETAVSFAVKEQLSVGFLYVFAFPEISGPVSISLESGTQVLSLPKITPPQARRPHFQNAFLVGEYPSWESLEDAYLGDGDMRNNFALRLLAKFRMENVHEWADQGFCPVPESLLFPDSNDEWFDSLKKIKDAILAESASSDSPAYG